LDVVWKKNRCFSSSNSTTEAENTERKTYIPWLLNLAVCCRHSALSNWKLLIWLQSSTAWWEGCAVMCVRSQADVGDFLIDMEKKVRSCVCFCLPSIQYCFSVSLFSVGVFSLISGSTVNGCWQ
jgi:hypothetical protein